MWYKCGSDLESNDGATNTTPGSFVTSDNINLSSFGSNIMIRFNFISGYGPDCFLDNVQIIEAPSCPQPSLLNAFNISSDSVTLCWNSSPNTSEWNVYLVYDTNGLLNTSPTLVNNDTVTLSVNPNSNYSFYVQSICGPSDSSLISGPYSFNTPCTPISSLPYIEDMSIWPPNCWDLTGGTQTCVHYNGSMAEASLLELDGWK